MSVFRGLMTVFACLWRIMRSLVLSTVAAIAPYDSRNAITSSNSANRSGPDISISGLQALSSFFQDFNILKARARSTEPGQWYG